MAFLRDLLLSLLSHLTQYAGQGAALMTGKHANSTKLIDKPAAGLDCHRIAIISPWHAASESLRRAISTGLSGGALGGGGPSMVLGPARRLPMSKRSIDAHARTASTGVPEQT